MILISASTESGKGPGRTASRSATERFAPGIPQFDLLVITIEILPIAHTNRASCLLEPWPTWPSLQVTSQRERLHGKLEPALNIRITSLGSWEETKSPPLRSRMWHYSVWNKEDSLAVSLFTNALTMSNFSFRCVSKIISAYSVLVEKQCIYHAYHLRDAICHCYRRALGSFQ